MPAAAATFSHLPDDAVERIFQCIELKERHRVLAAVCKRWRQLTLSPQLLRELDARFDGVGEGVLERVRSFCFWLARVAPLGPVEQLSLTVVPEGIWEDLEQTGTLTTLAAALAVCGSVGLRRLELGFYVGRMTLGHWAGMLGSQLHSLSITALGGVEVAAPLTLLTGLESLQLSGQIDWHAGAQLPPSLTRLELEFFEHAGSDVLQQLAPLTRLQSLRLLNGDVEEADFEAVVPRLSSLRDLSLPDCKPPLCISGMTGLESLCIRGMGNMADGADGEAVYDLQAVIQPLAQLTFLVLWDVRGADLPAVQGLHQLRELKVKLQTDNAAEPAQLLGGAWLAGLRFLSAEACVLGASLAILAAATQLEELEIYDFPSAKQATRRALLRWVASSPAPLRRLTVDRLPANYKAAALEAMLGKPALQIRELGY